MIVEGKPLSLTEQRRISFGTLAMVYTGTSNTVEGRAVSAIALRESNLSGGFYLHVSGDRSENARKQMDQIALN